MIRTISTTTALLVIVGFWNVCTAASAPPILNGGNRFSEAVVDRGPHYAVTETVKTGTNQFHQQINITNRYTTVAPGMNVEQPDGTFLPAHTEFRVQRDGSAAARNTRHAIILQPDITDPNGPIHFVSARPENLQFVTRPLCISYWDSATGKSVLIGEFRSTIGAVAPAEGKVVYADCCADFKCDLIVQNTLAGIESWLEILESPPPPSEFGLNNDSTRLELITEFLSSPQPVKSAVVKNGLTDDALLSWPGVHMPRGKAFKIGDSGSVGVRKQWTVMDGRQCLIESLDYPQVKALLNQLPGPVHASATTKDRTKRTATLERKLPKRVATLHTEKKKFQIAQSAIKSSGLVLDYSIVTTANGFTFQGGQTYLVTNNVDLTGGGAPTILEGGTVIKFMTNSSARITFFTIECKTGPYRPAIFTSINDNSVGETITGSTGNPANDLAGNVALYCGYPTFSSANLHDLRFSYLNEIYNADYGASDAVITVQNFQICSCASLTALPDTTWNLFNGLFWNVATIMDGGSCDDVRSLYGVNLTIHNCNHMQLCWKDSSYLTNCLLVNVTNFDSDASSTQGIFTNSVALLTSDTGVFQTVGGGQFYLADTNFMAAGTTNIDSALLATLRKKTTAPPILITTDINETTVFEPQASRDTNSSVDLGYHYDPIDYIFDRISFTADAILTNGTVVSAGQPGEDGGPALFISSTAQFLSRGSPTAPNWITWYNTVQETTGDGWPTSTSDMFQLQSPSATWDCRFTHFSALAGSGAYMSMNGANYEGDTRLHDCECFGGSFACWPWSGSYTFTNCLFDRCALYCYATGRESIPLAFENCLFYSNLVYLSAGANPPITFTNCLFDTTNISPQTSYILADYNAYLTNNPHRLTNSHDVLVTNFTYATSWLGNFYENITNTLNTGFTNADYFGLYHYTVLTNQVKETNSVTDIGYHYVAVDSNGNPIDTNGDGIPDYIQDANENGIVDNGEFDWINGWPFKVFITRPTSTSDLP